LLLESSHFVVLNSCGTPPTTEPAEPARAAMRNATISSRSPTEQGAKWQLTRFAMRFYL
jgi:hypothetical protein